MALATAASAEPGSASLRLALAAPNDDGHVAWRAARLLGQAAAERGIALMPVQAPLRPVPDNPLDIIVMPVRSLAARMPAFEVLELPYFFASLDAVHAAVDGPLGRHLAEEASTAGLHLLAIWDEGMHAMSGLKRFDWLKNLKAREFLFTRPDPVGERTFSAWRADVRRIAPTDRETVLRECLIANRATTFAGAVREQLFRVHLSLTPTRHRYEGWAVVVPADRWARFNPATRRSLRDALDAMRAAQRADAKSANAAALADLRAQGMIVYDVDRAERASLKAALPDWPALLSDRLSPGQKSRLIALASTRAAAPIGRPAAPQPAGDAAPGAQQDKRDQYEAGR